MEATTFTYLTKEVLVEILRERNTKEKEVNDIGSTIRRDYWMTPSP